MRKLLQVARFHDSSQVLIIAGRDDCGQACHCNSALVGRASKVQACK